MIIKSNFSGNDNASIAATESTPVEQTPVTSDAEVSVDQTASSENSQSNNEQSQAQTTPSGSGQPTSSDNPSKHQVTQRLITNQSLPQLLQTLRNPLTQYKTTVSGIDEKAWEVIKGRFGNGDERKATFRCRIRVYSAESK